MSFYDLAIIGGGAAGLFCAVQARKRGLDVAIIESNERVGKKLLATGNGRCNLTNIDMSSDKFNTNFVETLITKYTVETVLNEFKNLGLLTRIEDGRVYPYSFLSSSVLDALRESLSNANIEGLCDIFTSTTADAIVKDGGGYTVVTDKGIIKSNNVCLASGSNATFGKSSLNLLTALGHKTTELLPSLCSLPCEPNYIKGLQGIRHRVKACIKVGTTTYSEDGEILFKKDAISGIVIFNLCAVMARLHAQTAVITLDFIPDYSIDEIKRFSNQNTIKYCLHKNIYALLNDKIENAKNYKIPVSANHDRSQAQIISGGLDTDEFNPITLESKLINNIYACGEALNVDGYCGGYNLHWAWVSAIAVAEAVKHKINKSL